MPERSEENKQKENESYTCGECSRYIYKHLASIGCVKCGIYHHIRCAGFNNTKAAINAQETYECKKCTKNKKGNEKSNRINNNSTAKEEEGEIEWLGNKKGKGNGKKSKDDKSDDEKGKNKKNEPGKGNI